MAISRRECFFRYRGAAQLSKSSTPVAALTAMLFSTRWLPNLRVTLKAVVLWLALISLCYLVWRKAQTKKLLHGALQDG